MENYEKECPGFWDENLPSKVARSQQKKSDYVQDLEQTRKTWEEECKERAADARATYTARLGDRAVTSYVNHRLEYKSVAEYLRERVLRTRFVETEARMYWGMILPAYVDPEDNENNNNRSSSTTVSGGLMIKQSGSPARRPIRGEESGGEEESAEDESMETGSQEASD